jgi:hypothetical protein
VLVIAIIGLLAFLAPVLRPVTRAPPLSCGRAWLHLSGLPDPLEAEAFARRPTPDAPD